MTNETTGEPKARDGMPHSGQGARAPDRVRRDAVARNLCARIYDERRDLRALGVIDAVLSVLEDDDAVESDIVQQLERDQYHNDEGDEDGRKYRRGWNDATRRAIALVRIERGLAELRRQAYWPPDDDAPALHERFDLGGEAG